MQQFDVNESCQPLAGAISDAAEGELPPIGQFQPNTLRA
jgi:hypothetical protein